MVEVKCSRCGEWFAWPIELKEGEVLKTMGTLCRCCGKVTIINKKDMRLVNPKASCFGAK